MDTITSIATTIYKVRKKLNEVSIVIKVEKQVVIQNLTKSQSLNKFASIT